MIIFVGMPCTWPFILLTNENTSVLLLSIFFRTEVISIIFRLLLIVSISIWILILSVTVKYFPTLNVSLSLLSFCNPKTPLLNWRGGSLGINSENVSTMETIICFKRASRLSGWMSSISFHFLLISILTMSTRSARYFHFPPGYGSEFSFSSSFKSSKTVGIVNQIGLWSERKVICKESSVRVFTLRAGSGSSVTTASRKLWDLCTLCVWVKASGSSLNRESLSNHAWKSFCLSLEDFWEIFKSPIR